MKKFFSVLCLLGLLVMPVVACAPEEPEVEETDTLDVEMEEVETEMDEMDTEMDEMGTDMEEGMEEMDTDMEPPPAE